ncbi:MAG TPA: HD domain-containing protein [Thermoanaerobaculia bacterium]|nr:HD domain-containing protein [Thermoanaerobaculia bacterium]
MSVRKANQALLDLLLELQLLDRIPRAGYVLRGVAYPESVTEHSWHVLFLVWALAERIPEVDRERAVEIALVHDLAELRIGDLPRTAARYFPEGVKQAAETAAIDEVLAPLPDRARALYREYLDGETPEARLVKACDKLQLMVKVAVYERWSTGALAEFWDNPDNFADWGFEPVRQLFAELRRRHDQDRLPMPGPVAE